MKKRILLKAACIAGLTFLLLALIKAAIELRAAQMINLQKTYIAARDIPPRTKITEDDVIEIEIPEAYLQEYAVQDLSQLLGKYTDIQGKIPAGSPFYCSMLFSEKDMPDYPAAQLKKGQSAYTLETDLGRLGGAVIPGIRVDLYGTITKSDGSVVTGEVLESVRVISVKDHRGLEVSDEESDGTPYLVILAINSEDLAILTAIEEKGSIRLFPSAEAYDSGAEAECIYDSDVIAALDEQNMQ